jgi:hypothetical protein
MLNLIMSPLLIIAILVYKNGYGKKSGKTQVTPVLIWVLKLELSCWVVLLLSYI